MNRLFVDVFLLTVFMFRYSVYVYQLMGFVYRLLVDVFQYYEFVYSLMVDVFQCYEFVYSLMVDVFQYYEFVYSLMVDVFQCYEFVYQSLVHNILYTNTVNLDAVNNKWSTNLFAEITKQNTLILSGSLNYLNHCIGFHKNSLLSFPGLFTCFKTINCLLIRLFIGSCFIHCFLFHHNCFLFVTKLIQ